jgi:ABC-type transport system involved in multi-copper enzyme maturation permease subunit
VIEGAGPYRAALRLGRRRTLIILLGIAMAVLGVLSWGTYRDLNSERKFLHQLQTGRITQESFFRFGVACEGGPEGGVGVGGGPAPVEGGQEPGAVTPEKTVGLPTCQFVAPGGQPIGPTFQGDPFGQQGLSQTQIQQILPTLIEGQKQNVLQQETRLGPRRVFASRVHMLGTFIGIVFAVLLGATFFGAEFRWGIWKTLIAHEPRRGRVLLGKLVALWTLVLLGLAGVLMAVSVVDVVMRIVSDVHAAGGPSIVRLASQSGWALLSLETYATIAAALAIAARVTLAGLISLLMIIGDHILVDKYHWLRHYFPVQQISTLLPRPRMIDNGYVWLSPVSGGVVCPRAPANGQVDQNFFNLCREIIFKPIPQWRASLVLAGWAVGFALIAWGVLRARDVPA